MTAASDKSAWPGSISREVAVVGVLTFLGAVLRLWGLNHLGLVHFDEGIYAIAGLWSVSPRGLAALDPTLIAYAPPGFVVLVGVAYLLLGVSDLAGLLVSIVAGTLTIPATAWLARRTFGAGAGAAAAALVACSGFHVAYSRMALTDAPFLLCWVIGLICAQRFLERPRWSTALALGLSVGVAQLFKYNGWIIGAVVVLSATAGPIVDPNERQRARLHAIWVFGLLAALFAAAVYWPWFWFVEAHGGYSRLLAHHQSYLGGLGSWQPHLFLQLDQMVALSGGAYWTAPGYLAAVGCCSLLVSACTYAMIKRLSFLALSTVLIAAPPHIYWWIVGLWYLPGRRLERPSERLLGLAWLLLSIATPFYHPYARLWLPLHLLGWLVMAEYLRSGLAADVLGKNGPSDSPRRAHVNPLTSPYLWMIPLVFLVSGLGRAVLLFGGPGENPGPLSPSDTLRIAARQALVDLPKDTPGLRLLVRPPVTFYLGGRVPVQVEASLESLLQTRDPRLWGLVDLAQLRQEGDLEAAKSRLRDRWELVHEYPTRLNLPTLLDIDPGAARAGRSNAVNEPLWLLRPRRPGESR